MSYPPPHQPPPPRRGNSTTLVVIAVVLVVVVGLVGAGLVGAVAFTMSKRDSSGSSSSTASAPAPAPSPSGSLPAAPAGLEKYYDQELAWRSCGDNECSRLRVPLDYADPSGRSISIAVVRVPATDRANRIGQLVVNPGGPGGSGIDYAEGGRNTFGAALTRVYDIVGFDPRGVGKSTPVQCLGQKQTDAYVSSDPDPDTAAEVRAFEALNRAFGQACAQHSGELAAHLSTIEAAKDIDVLRAALGEPRLDYLGASYGTYLGSTYADLFPTHVGRMVLDGALDPALSNEQLTFVQAKGFQTALDAYLADCISRGSCPLGTSVAQGGQRLRQFLDQLDAKPLPTGTDRPLTEGARGVRRDPAALLQGRLADPHPGAEPGLPRRRQRVAPARRPVQQPWT